MSAEYNFNFDWNRISTLGKVKVLVEQVVGNPSQEAINTAVAEYIEAHPGSLSPLSPAVKSALLQIAEKVAYIDENGQSYYNALDAALNARALLSITAVYTQSGTVYDTDSLDSLKDDLVVTAYYDDGTTADVTSAAVLSGTLAEGTSTITATYQEKTATFNVTVSSKYVYYDYLQGDETAFIDTGLLASTYGNDNYKKHVKFRIGSTTKEKAVYGARNAWGTTGIYLQTAQSNFTVLFGNVATNIGARTLDELVEIDLDYPDLKVNGTSVKTVTSPTTQITFPAMTYPLFASAGGERPTSAYVSYNGGYVFQFSNHKIYEFTVTDKTTGDVVANMIPAMDTDTMTAGMYDTVRETFYSNARSTGTLTLGNDED